MEGKGSNLVEIVSTCNAGWKMTADANTWMEEHVPSTHWEILKTNNQFQLKEYPNERRNNYSRFLVRSIVYEGKILAYSV